MISYDDRLLQYVMQRQDPLLISEDCIIAAFHISECTVHLLVAHIVPKSMEDFWTGFVLKYLRKDTHLFSSFILITLFKEEF